MQYPVREPGLFSKKGRGVVFFFFVFFLSLPFGSGGEKGAIVLGERSAFVSDLGCKAPFVAHGSLAVSQSQRSDPERVAESKQSHLIDESDHTVCSFGQRHDLGCGSEHKVAGS